MKKTYTIDEKIKYYRDKIEWASKRIEQLENVKIKSEMKSFREYFSKMSAEDRLEYLKELQNGYEAHLEDALDEKGA